MTEPNTKILERISKLLAVNVARGATEAEAAIAAEHVQRMLQEHNLSLSTVEQAQGDGYESTIKREKVNTGLRAMYKYQRDLMGAVADSNFCLHKIVEVKTPRRSEGPDRMSQQHVLVGREVNVKASTMLYDYLIVAVKRAATDAGYTEGKDGRYFMEGAVSRLTERLAARRRERERESAANAAQAQAKGNGTGKELVLADVYGSELDQNNDVLNGFPLGTTAKRRAETQRREHERKEMEKQLVADGVDPTEAFYRSLGYGVEEAAALAQPTPTTERERQRGRGRSQRFTRGDRDYWAKVGSPAYGAGREAGSKIGLDGQLNASTQKRLK